MFNKLFLIILGVVVTVAMSVAQAGTRANAPLKITKFEDPVSEKKCLEAYVNARFLDAYTICLPLAQKGMRDAQLVTGLMYVFGEGIEKNLETAKLWLRKASRNGSEEAKEILAEFK